MESTFAEIKKIANAFEAERDAELKKFAEENGYDFEEVKMVSDELQRIVDQYIKFESVENEPIMKTWITFDFERALEKIHEEITLKQIDK